MNAGLDGGDESGLVGVDGGLFGHGRARPPAVGLIGVPGGVVGGDGLRHRLDLHGDNRRCMVGEAAGLEVAEEVGCADGRRATGRSSWCGLVGRVTYAFCLAARFNSRSDSSRAICASTAADGSTISYNRPRRSMPRRRIHRHPVDPIDHAGRSLIAIDTTQPVARHDQVRKALRCRCSHDRGRAVLSRSWVAGALTGSLEGLRVVYLVTRLALYRMVDAGELAVVPNGRDGVAERVAPDRLGHGAGRLTADHTGSIAPGSSHRWARRSMGW